MSTAESKIRDTKTEAQASSPATGAPATSVNEQQWQPGGTSNQGDNQSQQADQPPALFAEYGQTGKLAADYITQQIHKSTQPIMWHVHGVQYQVVGITPDGKLLCETSDSQGGANVQLDQAAFEKLLNKLIG